MSADIQTMNNIEELSHLSWPVICDSLRRNYTQNAFMKPDIQWQYTSSRNQHFPRKNPGHFNRTLLLCVEPESMFCA